MRFASVKLKTREVYAEEVINCTQCTSTVVGLLHLVRAQCSSSGVILSASSGSFNSPNYPSNYPNSRTCRWIIVVQEGHRVQLTFQTFVLETCVIPSVCTCDHVEIRDGSDGSSPSFGRFCGNNKPSPIHSSGRSLWIEFDSDLTTNEKGFSATYTTIGMILLLLSQSFEVLIHIADCYVLILP